MFEKMVWRALTPAIFQFAYKKGKKNPKFDQKNLEKIEKTFFLIFFIMIKILVQKEYKSSWTLWAAIQSEIAVLKSGSDLIIRYGDSCFK